MNVSSELDNKKICNANRNQLYTAVSPHRGSIL